ncbi:2118_t:CDS:1, partial [Entrophospora sp. SA101]
LKLQKRSWDHNPENRPTAEEIYNGFGKYYYYQSKGKKDY